MRKLLPILAACVVMQSLSAAAAPLAFTTLGCALAWGLVELLALQRHRLQGLHRGRLRQLPPPPPQL